MSAAPDKPLNPYERILAGESLIDIAEKKATQAEALSRILYGEMEFSECSGDIQDKVLWLLSDLIAEANRASELEKIFRHPGATPQ